MNDPNDGDIGRRDDHPKPPDSTKHGRVGGLALLIGACALGLLLRCMRYQSVFPPEGGIYLGLDDAQFHARRALFSFANFPAVLGFDSFIAYPDGAAAPVPPFFDWATAGVARLFGDDTQALETVAAWVSPVVGALLIWPAYLIGRSVASRGVGLTAAALTAVLPSGILVTSLGNFDHHGAVALIAACWLAVSLSSVGLSGRDLAIRSALQACVIALMLFTWSGSLLYLALGVGAQLAAILLFHGRPKSLFAMGASLLGAAAPTGLWLANSTPPLGGPFSSQTLSWLHLLALLGIAGSVLLLAVWEGWRPSNGPVVRLSRFALLAGAICLPLLAFPAIREQVLQGLFFLAQQDEWAASNPEQLPLFHSSTLAATATVRFGLFAYLVPLVPFYVAWCVTRSRDRERLVVLLMWASALSVLLLSQVRYGTDFTVPGAVVFAMILLDVQRWVSRRLPVGAAGAAAATLAALALLPAATGFHQPLVALAFVRPPEDTEPGTPSRMSLHQLGVRFGERVREVTPEVSGFLEPGKRPEYGILVPSHIGHRFIYTARRPTPSNNLGPYLDVQKYRRARAFYRARNVGEAMRILEDLDVRYLVTTSTKGRSSAFADYLHNRNESSVDGRPTTGRLRLVLSSEVVASTNSKAAVKARPSRRARFKLFELVEGAVLVVETEAGNQVQAEIRLVIGGSHAVLYKTTGRAGPNGVARLRVSYPTRHAGTVATPGLWRVRAGGRELRYEVSEVDLQEGREVHALEATVPDTGSPPIGSRGPGADLHADFQFETMSEVIGMEREFPSLR